MLDFLSFHRKDYGKRREQGDVLGWLGQGEFSQEARRGHSWDH